MRPSPRLEDKRHNGAIPGTYTWMTPKGAAYYPRAATSGDARAQALLAFLYSAGRGVKQDHAKALQWYLQAANQGDAYAQLDLARLYREGGSVGRNNVQAYKWYVIAGLHDDICDCLLDGKDIVVAEMTGQEIQRAERLAREWRLQHGCRPLLILRTDRGETCFHRLFGMAFHVY